MEKEEELLSLIMNVKDKIKNQCGFNKGIKLVEKLKYYTAALENYNNQLIELEKTNNIK